MEYNTPSNYVKSQPFYYDHAATIEYNTPSNYVKSQQMEKNEVPIPEI